MFLAVHAATGALLAQQTNNPLYAFALGMISHYVLDAIPHGDECLEVWHKNGEKKKVFAIISLDFFAMFCYVLVLFSSDTLAHPGVVAWGVFGSVLPDFIQAYYLLTKKFFLEKLCQFHVYNHNILGRTLLYKITKKYDRISLKVGLLVQAITLLLILKAW